MYPKTRLAIIAALLTLTATPATAFEARAYHDANCTRCHDTGVYTRENRGVVSYAMLESRVGMCDINFGAKLAPNELAQLVDYLNSNFYQFEK